MDKCRQDFELACGTEDMFASRPEALEQYRMDWKLWTDAARAEREACAAIADARAMRCEAKAALAEDADEVTRLRSLAWQFSVLAAEMRKRSNAADKLTGGAVSARSA